MRELKIDRELRSLLPPLEKEQRALLRKLIEEEGCQDAIKVWKGEDVIVDGHNRYEICTELGCGFKVLEIPFADKAAVAEWMVNFQEGRRNMTPAAISAARGLAYNLRKQPKGGDKKTEEAKSKCQVDTSEEIAAETGVSKETVKRDGKFQETLAKLSVKARESILAGEVRKPSQQALDRLLEYDAPSQQAIIEAVKSGAFASIVAALDSEEKPDPKPKAQKSKQISPAERIKANRKLLKDYIAKTVNAVDDYHVVKPNQSSRESMIKLLQQAGQLLW